MRSKSRKHLTSVLLLSLALAAACGPKVWQPRLHKGPNAPPYDPKSAGLRVHLRSGELVILDSWSLPGDGSALVGSGTRYDVQRTATGQGSQSIPREQIALLETNDPKRVSSLAVAGLSALTLFFGTVSGICISDPKSCFGSCPTFYADGGSSRPLAEGFSSSVARVLEARDVDALPDLETRAGRLALTMRNEALETHAVRRVRVLAVPRPPGAEVFATAPGDFRVVDRLVPPARCIAPEGQCREDLARPDGRERGSQSDAQDLAAREELILEFEDAPPSPGLVIGARQSLLTTFLFYQTLAYMGGRAGDWLAALERGGRDRALELMSMGRHLGDIEVAVADGEGRWLEAGAFGEHGPIAGDVQVVPLPNGLERGALRVRLRMARGLWRIDQVRLGRLGPSSEARAHAPVLVERGGRADAKALELLREGNGHLITLPGDAYRLSFAGVGDRQTTALFLETEGYYYEWMREEWLWEEDPAMLALVVAQPAEALRRLAPPWKEREATAERTFWSSRFGGTR